MNEYTSFILIAGQGGHNQFAELLDGTFIVGRCFTRNKIEYIRGEEFKSREAAQERFDEKESAVSAYFTRYGTANE